MIGGMRRRTHFAAALGLLVSATVIVVATVRATTGCRSYGAWWAEGYVPVYVLAAAGSLTIGAYFFARALASRHPRAWAVGVFALGGPGIWFVFVIDGLSDCPP
jgi:hypothetical protein